MAGCTNQDQYQYICHDHPIRVLSKEMPTITVWVKNMSSIPLTEAQEHLLVHGSNFAIAPKSLLIGEYITEVEQTCQKLSWGRLRNCEQK